MAGEKVAGALTRLQCCPVGEGAAAAIVVSESAVSQLKLDPTRMVRVVSSVGRSQSLGAASDADATLTRETIHRALHDAEITAAKLDVVEMHDAFAIEELLY